MYGMLFFLSLLVTQKIHASELIITKDGRCKILQDMQVLSQESEDLSNTKDTSKKIRQEDTSKQSSEQEEPSEIDEDPMLSDDPQKRKDRSKLTNPETSDKVNKKEEKEDTRSIKSYKKGNYLDFLDPQPLFYQSLQIEEDDSFLYATQQRTMLNKPSTEVYRLEINRISAQLLTELCKDSKLPQTCGKNLRSHLEIIPQIYDVNQQIVCSGVQLAKERLKDPTGQREYTEQRDMEIQQAVSQILRDVSQSDISEIFISLPQHGNGCLVGGYTQSIYQQFKDSLREQNINVKNKPSVKTSTIEMIVQDQKHAWKISIQNRDSQKRYHQFLIPNEILGEDLSIRSCMSSEQRDINMGYKEYSNSSSSLGISLEISQKEACVTESIDLEIGLKDNIPPLTSFQIFGILQNPDGTNIFIPLNNKPSSNTEVTRTHQELWHELFQKKRTTTSVYLHLPSQGYTSSNEAIETKDRKTKDSQKTKSSNLALIALPSYQQFSLSEGCYTSTSLTEIFPNYDFAYTSKKIQIFDVNHPSCVETEEEIDTGDLLTEEDTTASVHILRSCSF